MSILKWTNRFDTSYTSGTKIQGIEYAVERRWFHWRAFFIRDDNPMWMISRHMSRKAAIEACQDHYEIILIGSGH